MERDQQNWAEVKFQAAHKEVQLVSGAQEWLILDQMSVGIKNIGPVPLLLGDKSWLHCFFLAPSENLAQMMVVFDDN